MRKHLILVLVIIASLFCFGACSVTGEDSSFTIRFLDVGQGDSAIVECDGHYMMIDGGDTSAGQKVYDALEEQRIQHLDILVVSHLHRDHFGGLEKALRYASTIDKTISNRTEVMSDAFRKFEHQLGINGSIISVPHEGDKFELGSAEVEVIDASIEDENDSLVILVTYGKTRFLFTGDINKNTQSRIAKQYMNDEDEPFKINVMKMPHHGAEVSYLFIRTFMPDYAVISVGENTYGHPSKDTLEMLDQAEAKVYRTDQKGDIVVKSDGKHVSFE